MSKNTYVRFFSKIESVPTTACWLWKGSINKNGYGKFCLAGRSTLAHRASYIIFVSSIPEGLVLDHLCQIKNCVNPDHLEPITQQENIRRAKAGYINLKPLGVIFPPRIVKPYCAYGHRLNKENILRINQRKVCKTCNKLPISDWYVVYKERIKNKKTEGQSPF